MPLPASDLLPVAAAALGVAAASLTGFGWRHAQPRGWRWWMASVWLATLGALLAASLPHVPWPFTQGAVRFAAEMLLLQWPLTLLIGLRRFHARDALPGHASLDFALLLAAAPVLAAASLLAPAEAPWVAAAAGSLALLHAAVVALRTPVGHATPPLQALAAVQGLLALAPLAAWTLMAAGDERSPLSAVALAGAGARGLADAPSALPADPLAWRSVAAALGVTVAAFVVLTMVGRRVEQQLRESRQRLRTLANMDALTQVPNRRHFSELAVQALEHDPPGSTVLLMFDVDHFKGINDSLGHAAGDRALTLVAGGMLEQLRARDVPGRLGGDEFALLLRSAGVPAAIGVAERIVRSVQQRSAEQQLPRLTLSFGVVQVASQEQLDAALRRADQALFEAKRQGRNCAVAAEGDEAHPVFSESQRLGLAAA
ncbi:MAG: GGDEF domain-containing protein [Rubrivivax sp.]|nr:GGDEF domain-containing protein [Rubrivivax sp.]